MPLLALLQFLQGTSWFLYGNWLQQLFYREPTCSISLCPHCHFLSLCFGFMEMDHVLTKHVNYSLEAKRQLIIFSTVITTTTTKKTKSKNSLDNIWTPRTLYRHTTKRKKKSLTTNVRNKGCGNSHNTITGNTIWHFRQWLTMKYMCLTLTQPQKREMFRGDK